MIVYSSVLTLQALCLM